MKPAISVADRVFEHLGKKAIADIDAAAQDPRGANEKLLLRILDDNKDTEYGRKYGFADIHSIEEFREKVPFSNYDDYFPYIQRMVKNKETNLITAYDVIQYAETSGSVGVQKKIPVTDKSMAVYEKYSFSRTKAIASIHHQRKYGRRVPAEKGLNMLETETTEMDDGTPRGSVSGSVSRRFRKFFPLFLTSPDPILFPIGGMNMNYMKARFALEEPKLVFILCAFMTGIVDMMNFIKSNWELIVNDIENGTIDESMCEPESMSVMMSYVEPNPQRAQELRRIFEEGFDTPIIPRIWPNLSWACAIGTGGFASYTEKFKRYAGNSVAIDYFVYAASEGMFAACINMDDPRFAPLTDSCFFEFIPIDGPSDTNETLTLDQLEEGKEYEVVITNQCGFYRYKIEDVIRVVGMYNKCPLITFACRKSQLLNVAAEKTTEEHLDETVKRLGAELGCTFVDYCIYLDDSGDVSRYIALLEPDSEIPIDEDGSYADAFERILREVNIEYAVCADDGSLGKPLVLIQQQQTHALWRDVKLRQGSSANQVKPVRVLDVPVKQKFFFGLIEEGQETPDWDFYYKKRK